MVNNNDFSLWALVCQHSCKTSYLQAELVCGKLWHMVNSWVHMEKKRFTVPCCTVVPKSLGPRWVPLGPGIGTVVVVSPVSVGVTAVLRDELSPCRIGKWRALSKALNHKSLWINLINDLNNLSNDQTSVNKRGSKWSLPCAICNSMNTKLWGATMGKNQRWLNLKLRYNLGHVYLLAPCIKL